MTMTGKHVYTLPYKYGNNFPDFFKYFLIKFMANICSKICQVKKYHFGSFYMDFEHDRSGCDPEFIQFGAYWHIWFTMGSCPQGQISFLFDGHGVVFFHLLQ